MSPIRSSLLLSLTLFFTQIAMAQPTQKPLRVGVVGLVHTHVHGILNKAFRQKDQNDINIVGIAEPNRALAERYAGGRADASAPPR